MFRGYLYDIIRDLTYVYRFQGFPKYLQKPLRLEGTGNLNKIKQVSYEQTWTK